MNRAMLALGMRSPKQRLVVATVLVVVAAGMLAGQTNVEALRSKAAHGDAEAQYNLGVMHVTGQGVQQDYDEALKWFRRCS